MVNMRKKTGVQKSASPTPTTQSMFSNFEFDQLSAEERLYLHAARMGDMILLNEVLENLDSQNLTWNCVDYMGRNSIHLAVDSENIDMIEMLIEKVSFEGIEEGLLHAISKGLLNVVRMIIDHPRYLSEQAQQMKVIGKKDAFFRKEEKYQYPPDITPLILAAHHNDHEIIQLFISRGYTIQRPHAIHCQCQDCRSKQQCDSLKRSRSRLNAYKALASPSYLALSSPDPITESFELRKELILIAQIEKEFKKDYLELVEQCMEFTCCTMSLCRGTQEMEAILSQGSEGQEPLARLRLAVQNEEKMFVAHPNTQQHLTNLWYGKEMQFLHGWTSWRKLCAMFICPFIAPFFCIFYIFFPNTKVGRAMRCPITKFITHTMSHLIFLFLLGIATFGLEERIGDDNNFDSINPSEKVLSSIENIEMYLRHHFRPAKLSFSSLMTYGQLTIGFWVIGNLCLECKQVYNSGMKEHFRQYYNIMDYLILTFYLASYSLRFSSYYRLKEAEDTLHYVQLAKEALQNRNLTEFQIIRNLSKEPGRELNYFMAPSRFEWEMDDPEIVSNVLFAFANVLSFARTTYLMPSHELLGPLQISLGRMITDIIRFTVLFLLVLLAFMVGMTNLYTYYGYYDAKSGDVSKGEDFKAIKSFEGLWQTVTTLFFSMFGLITLDKLEIKKPDSIVTNHDSTLLVTRVGLILFAMFQVLVTIVLVNMLIAMMSHSFEAIQGDTDVEWKFARTKLWLNFIDEESTLPVPFNIIPTSKTFKYMILWCKNYFTDDDDELSLYKYDFSKRRENVVLAGLESSGLVFSKSTYTDIIQRIMRRYLFKMDRDKAEIEKKEGTVVTECTGLNENETETESTDIMTLSHSSECITILEEGGEEDNQFLKLPPLPAIRDSPGSRMSYRRDSEHEDAFRRSARRSTKTRKGVGSLKTSSSFSGNSLQLDAIQRGQRLLDARMQELLAHRTENEVIKKNMAVIRQIIVQNHQDVACLLEVMKSMSSDLVTLIQTFNQFIGFKIRKEKKKASRVQAPASPHASPELTVTVEEEEDEESTTSAIPITVSSPGVRSNSSPGLMPSTEGYGQRRTSLFSTFKRKLSTRQSHPSGPSNVGFHL